MQVGELNDTEREVFLALLAHLAEADARIDPGEILELDGLAEQMGLENMRERLMWALGGTPTRQDLLAAVAKVERPHARALIQGLLSDLAESDGERAAEENEILELVARAWRA